MPRSPRILKTSFGVVLALAVLALAPSAAFAEFPEAPVTEAAGSITGTTATFKGELNPGASAERVSYRFAYSPGEECGGFLNAPAEGPFPEAEGNHKKVSVPVTGLEAVTTYKVCLVAANPLEEGEATTGSTVEFTTPASKPVVLAQTAAGVTPFAASLQAEINPENQSTTSCVFEYGKALAENKLPCEQLELSGGAPEIATRALAGLSPSTKYHFRVIVKNATGETKGAEQTFETAASEKPAITGETVSGIQPFQARLEASLNPNFQPTKCTFSYGVSVGEHTVGCEPELLEGFGEQPVGTTVAGLEAETTYHYRALAKNAAGETEGEEQEFTTLALEAPIFISENPATVTATDATLEARLNPDAQETSYGFEYATEETLLLEEEGARVNSETPLPAVFEELAAGPVDLGNTLTPGTTYLYRVIASNATGETKGPIQEFTTSPPEPPVVGSETATNVGETTVDFEASINPLGQETTYSFEFATDEAFTENTGSVPGELPLPPVSEELPVGPLHATGLKAATVYYYRAVATNPIMGTTNGSTQTFHTLGKPVVTTGEAEATTSTTATVSGTVNPGGAPTTYRFVYVAVSGYQPGATECPENLACAYAKGAATSNRSIPTPIYVPQAAGPIALEELKSGTTYHYALVATNATGTTVGPDQTFATLPAAPPIATTGEGVQAAPASPAVFALPPVFTPLPFTPIVALTTKEAKENKLNVRAELLAKALKACHHKPKGRRAKCVRQARRKYQANKHKA